MSIYFMIMYFILMYYTIAMFYCVLRDIHMKVAYKAISRLNESQAQKAMSLQQMNRGLKMALQDVLGNIVVLSSIVPSLAVSMVPQVRYPDGAIRTTTSQGGGGSSASAREDAKRSSMQGGKAPATSARVAANVNVNPSSPASLIAQSVMSMVSNMYVYIYM
jgi:hypothetical protein